MRNIFLLSPARTTGRRAVLLLNPKSDYPLALRLHRNESVPIGEIFSFLSGLYFRGKRLYAETFAAPEDTLVITSNQGLLPVETPISLPEFRTFAESEIDPRNESYRRPLEIDLAKLCHEKEAKVILLGSIASPKYIQVLKPFFPNRLWVPSEFPGMGDMSRGASLLRHAAQGTEMSYEILK